MYEQILFPTDGSDGAAAALDHVQDLAEQYDATVHVLNVVDTKYPEIGMIGEELDEAGSGMMAERHEDGGSALSGEEFEGGAFEDHAVATVQSVAAEFDDATETVTEIRYGTPHDEIIAYIDDNDIDLVVMGTHGRTGVDRFLLGSVTERVVRRADVPVLTARLDAAT